MDPRQSVAVALDDAERRSPRGFDEPLTARRLRPGRRRAGRPDAPFEEPVEKIERLAQLQDALIEPGADVTVRPVGGAWLEVRVLQPESVLAYVDGDARPACRRPDGAESLDVLGSEDPDVREPVLERGVELELAPATFGRSANRIEFPVGVSHGAGVQLEGAAAELDRAEQKAVSGQDRVEPACAFGESREMIVARGEADTGADGSDVVEVAPETLELEQDRPCAGELRGRFEPESRLACVGVGEAVRDRAGRAGAADVAGTVREGAPLGGGLEAAVLVEEAGVEVENPFADDVEAEVARLDDASVDRADRDLVEVLPRTGTVQWASIVPRVPRRGCCLSRNSVGRGLQTCSVSLL